MAKIAEYNAPVEKLRPSDAGYSASETAARQIRVSYNEAGTADREVGTLANDLARTIAQEQREAGASRVRGLEGGGGRVGVTKNYLGNQRDTGQGFRDLTGAAAGALKPPPGQLTTPDQAFFSSGRIVGQLSGQFGSGDFDPTMIDPSFTSGMEWNGTDAQRRDLGMNATDAYNGRLAAPALGYSQTDQDTLAGETPVDPNAGGGKVPGPSDDGSTPDTDAGSTPDTSATTTPLSIGLAIAAPATGALAGATGALAGAPVAIANETEDQ